MSSVAISRRSAAFNSNEGHHSWKAELRRGKNESHRVPKKTSSWLMDPKHQTSLCSKVVTLKNQGQSWIGCWTWKLICPACSHPAFFLKQDSSLGDRRCFVMSTDNMKKHTILLSRQNYSGLTLPCDTTSHSVRDSKGTKLNHNMFWLISTPDVSYPFSGNMCIFTKTIWKQRLFLYCLIPKTNLRKKWVASQEWMTAQW